jgi:flagellar motor switch protein FliM
MAEDILSQEEVDALLRGVSGEADETAAEAPGAGGVQPYDIGRQERVVRGRMPTLELVHERFARALRGALANLTRHNVEISVAPVRVLRYSEFLRNLAVPANLNLVHVKPLRGTGLMVFEPNLVFQVIDTLFGGQGKLHTRIEGRELTPTEMRIDARMLNLAFDAYQKAWQPVHPVTLEHVRSETNPQFVNIAVPSEVVVTATLSVDLGGAGGDFHVCLPYAMLEPIRSIIYSSVQAERGEADSRWLSLLSAQVYRAEAEVVANLAHASVSIGQLMSLQAGDVVAFDLPELVTATVNGVPVLECRYGVVRGQYALKVERMLSGEQDGGQ